MLTHNHSQNFLNILIIGLSVLVKVGDFIKVNDLKKSLKKSETACPPQYCIACIKVTARPKDRAMDWVIENMNL